MGALITSSPLPDLTPAGSLAAEPTQATPTVVRFVAHDPEVSILAATPSPPSAPGPWLAAAVLLAGAFGASWVLWRDPATMRRSVRLAQLRIQALAGQFTSRGRAWIAAADYGSVGSWVRAAWGRSRAASRPSGGVLNTANAAEAVRAMIVDTRACIATLTGAGPLADVLSQELVHIKARLEAVASDTREGDDQAGRTAIAFRNLMRDVERVRRIADSAAISMGGARPKARIPQTRAEAYDLLGLNPDVADQTLKKVADGLRMSWHPDHARDEADRIEREARIKSINVAIELINGKRVAA
jgi:hypothetical protein